MKKTIKLFLTSMLSFLLVVGCTANTNKSIKSQGVGQGKHGEIKVEVTLDNNKITQIDVIEEKENEVLAKPVYTDLKDEVIRLNSTDVDTITGSTVTSEGFLEAINDALTKANVTLVKNDDSKKDSEEVIKEQTFDVVVIGAGGAGFASAIEAARANKKVVILEKMPTIGGNTLISGGEMNVPNSWVQKELNIEDSVDLYYEDTMKGGDNAGNPSLVRLMAENALPAAEWLKNDIKVEFLNNQLFRFGGHSVKRALIPVGHTGQEMISKLKGVADSLNIETLVNMKAVKLIKDESGKIVGVIANDKNNNEIKFNANNGVVLASGGFGSNIEMRKQYNAEFDERYKSTDTEGTTGDGIVMAQEIGADITNMESIQTYPIANPKTGVISLLADTRFDGAILVNQEGKRFVEELDRRDVISRAILAQTGGYCYQIWNDDIDAISHTKQNHEDEYNELIKDKLLVKADTIEEAAKFFDIDVENLKETINKVNEYAKNKEDKDFNHRGGLVSLEKGPYYIEKAVPSVHHTMGGLVINEKTEVLDSKGNPIPGLYAAGEITGVIQGHNRLGGNAITDIIVFGRIAGQEVSK